MTFAPKVQRLRVNRRRPCPICGRDGWCLIHPQGIDCICPRTPSPKPIYSRGTGEFVGYLHVLQPGQVATASAGGTYAQPEAPRRKDLPDVAKRFQGELTDRRIDIIARSLGVSVESLRRLGIGWCVGHGAAAFPMRNEQGEIIGIRLRTDEGAKFAVKGGRQGLFIPSDLTGNGPLLLCEGPTSLAALLDFGFDAIGRPASNGGVWLTLQWLRRHARRRDVIALGDHDCEKHRPDGSVFYPGQEGAEQLAREIVGVCRSVKVVVPPFSKDARDWKRDGATRDVIEAVIRAANYVRRSEP